MRLALPLLLAILVLTASCGQKDPILRAGRVIALPQGEIEVTSSVPGAVISLDGAATGSLTPDTLRCVSTDAHVVAVYLEGYYSATRVVTGVVGTVNSVHFDLQTIPTTGAVTVTAPYPGDILLDGIPTGRAAPATLNGVEPGNRSVAVSLRGFRPEPLNSTVAVNEGVTAVVAFQLVAAKKILCLDYSNYACDPCPPADAALQEVIAEDPEQRVSMNPHLYWPSPTDPIFEFNKVANCGLGTLHEVSTMPAILVDGLLAEPPDAASMRARVQERSTPTAPVAIGVRGGLRCGDYHFTVDVWGVGSGIPARMVLYACVVEREVILDPPGPNGQSHFVNVLREVLPSPQGTCPDQFTFLGGQDVSIGQGDHLTFDHSYAIPGGDINPARLAVIAFAYDPATKLIVQTGTSFDLTTAPAVEAWRASSRRPNQPFRSSTVSLREWESQP